MIEAIVQIAMGTILLCGTIAIGVSLLKMHRDPNAPNLKDLITATDKGGQVRLDARKCFEAGCFLTSTWGFVYLVTANRFTEWYFSMYMLSWVGARYLRDREKRLGAQQGSGAG